MAGTQVAPKRTIRGRAKVKTGCITCRIRKIKCDEDKPFCKKCVTTGRTCDGYESPFRLATTQAAHNSRAGIIKSNPGSQLQLIQPMSVKMTPQDVDLLGRYFSTKTIFNVDLGCNEEAKQIMQASLTDPPIRHAFLSLRTLREELETIGDGPKAIWQQAPSCDYGLQQYSIALRALAFKLSSPSPEGLKSALLCCHVFISIEQVRGNFAAMSQHIIRGLGIMREYRARPYLTAENTLLPAHYTQLPLLDVFIVKLFAAPCKFAESASSDVSEASSVCSSPPDQQLVESRDLRKIAPNMRTELVKIATSTLELLARASHVQTKGNALRLLADKADLLDALELWFSDLELVQSQAGLGGPQPLSMYFMRFFHQTLKIVLLGVLESSPELDSRLRLENDRFQSVASAVTEKFIAYRRYCGIISG